MQLVGQELGLSEDIARQLASQTALGAAKMAKNSDLSPAQLREQVTSPGGTTERALNTFQQEDLEAIFRKAMTSAVARAEQMSKDFSE
jgi:pyrroline-5-carboxylate reductase